MPTRKEWVVDETGYHAVTKWEPAKSDHTAVYIDPEDIAPVKQEVKSPYAKVVLDEVELIPGPDGFALNKKFKVRVPVDIRDQSAAKRVTIQLFCVYKGKEIEIKPGPQGVTGATGLKGDKGDTGATGPAGTTTWGGLTDVPTPVQDLANNSIKLIGADHATGLTWSTTINSGDVDMLAEVTIIAPTDGYALVMGGTSALLNVDSDCFPNIYINGPDGRDNFGVSFGQIANRAIPVSINRLLPVTAGVQTFQLMLSADWVTGCPTYSVNTRGATLTVLFLTTKL